MAVRRKKRRGRMRLTGLGKALAALLVLIVAGVFALTRMADRNSSPNYTNEKGSGIPISFVASAEATPVPTPTPTPEPSPTPTIRLIVTPAPEDAATPTPAPRSESRYPTTEEINGAVEAKLSTGGVNLRAGPSTRDKVIQSGLSKNSRIKVYARENDFYFIQVSSSGQYGYVSCKFVEVEGFTPAPIATQIPKGAVGGSVNSKSLTLRNGPGTDYTSIYEYTKGTLLYVYFQTADWYYVEVPQNGAKGYMSCKYVTVEANPPAGTPVP